MKKAQTPTTVHWCIGMSRVPKRWLSSYLWIYCVRILVKESKNQFIICRSPLSSVSGTVIPRIYHSSHLKMDGWKTSFLLGWPIFRGQLLVSGRVPFIFKKKPLQIRLTPGDVMAQTFSRSSWARRGETSSTGPPESGTIGTMNNRVGSKKNQQVIAPPGKNCRPWDRMRSDNQKMWISKSLVFGWHFDSLSGQEIWVRTKSEDWKKTEVGNAFTRTASW